jgi:hypothetical protein
MLHFMREGGWVMWIIAALSIALLVIAVRFLLKPDPARLAVLRALSWAQIAAVVGGVSTNVATTCKAVAREHARSGVVRVEWLIQGLGESLAPAGMGFTILAFVWLMIVFGVRKAHLSAS